MNPWPDYFDCACCGIATPYRRVSSAAAVVVAYTDSLDRVATQSPRWLGDGEPEECCYCSGGIGWGWDRVDLAAPQGSALGTTANNSSGASDQHVCLGR